MYSPLYVKPDHLWVVPAADLQARRQQLDNLMYEHPSLGAEWMQVQDELRLIAGELERRNSHFAQEA